MSYSLKPNKNTHYILLIFNQPFFLSLSFLCNCMLFRFSVVVNWAIYSVSDTVIYVNNVRK